MGVNDDNGVRGDSMDALESSDFLWPGEVEVLWNIDAAEIYLKFLGKDFKKSTRRGKFTA